MNGSMHLEEIAFHVAPGAHAVLILDQAGWHGSAELVVPANITCKARDKKGPFPGLKRGQSLQTKSLMRGRGVFGCGEAAVA